MTDPVLKITGLTVEIPTRRGVVRPVRDVSWDIRPGEIVGVVGESGAGKSMTGNAVIGLLDRPAHISAGEIDLDGRRIDDLPEREKARIRGRRIAMIFQDPLTSLNPLFTVGQQLVETIRAHLDVSAGEARERAVALLDRVGIPDPGTRVDQYPHQFSGGMRQRVVIALALCAEPEVVVADEPTTALDVSIQAQILDLIRELARERGMGVMLVTHDMGVIAETTDRVNVMYDGEIVESGPTARVLGAPEHPYTQSLVAAVPRPDRKLRRFPQVSYGGRETAFRIEDLARDWPARPAGDGPFLEARGLTKRFLEKGSLIPSRRRWFTAVDDASFAIRPGEVFGLVGESGSGKSTIARMIAGLYPLDEGEVRFEGEVVAGAGATEAARDAYRSQVQMIFQDPFSSLNPRHRVDRIVAEPALHLGVIPKANVTARVGELLDRVGLGAEAGLKYPHEFSGGQRQRISIARALATQPRFLICDEPTSALDVSIQAQILNILKDLQEHLGLTMLFISHDLPVVRQMCDRVGVLKDGRLVEVAETARLFEAPEHPYTRELISLMPKTDLLSNAGLAAE
ncbi:peptide/nickel transport system ATP-binding protein [Hasllibacter halocynthiae]|uniref:Peptide/nickel transport system ATP-binding protein n=1 Tax=Hasllibacter halocynthiae TaxID=595589 RepID=A0A2T0X295_9RHOB|nr:ABC transporter ATP-binding protein [Hasllibacter halocynthiae]PRY93060.1 peptide/nickel transport system ATP-binding protein [Hasllibacter halocynthiae]